MCIGQPGVTQEWLCLVMSFRFKDTNLSETLLDQEYTYLHFKSVEMFAIFH